MNAVVNLGAAFQAPVSSAFQGMDAGDDLSAGVGGGYGLIRYRGKVWTIHFQQQDITLMRPDGDGPQNSIEVVILKANPHLSKTWYEAGFDENSTSPPDCASANGVTPDAGVPKRQSAVCATCPRNQWNTAPGGGKGKACGDHRRMAVAPADDLPNESYGGPMLLRCPAASLQDLAAFDSKYKQAGYPYYSMRVRIAFDPKESYPKFVFTAVRPLTDVEAALVIAHRNSDLTARVIADAPAPAEPAPVTQQVAFEQQPVQQAAPAAAFQQAQPVAQPAQVAQPAPAVQRPATTMTGFGGAVAQPATSAAAAVAQTGFGGAVAQPAAQTAAQPAQTAQPVVQQSLPLQPATAQQPVVTAFDASLDDKIAALIATSPPTPAA